MAARGLAVGLLLALGAPTVLAEEATARSRLEAVLGPDARIELHVLMGLGWRVVSHPGAGIDVHAGTPCRRTSLRAAQQAGDLQIRVPAAVSAEAATAFAARLPALLDGLASRGAYNLRLAAATDRATGKLMTNVKRGNYIFPRFLVFETPFWQLDPPAGTWVEQGGGVYRARGAPSKAIEAFYTQRAATECYAGQQVAVFASQYELYGARAFDAAFRPAEIAIGGPPAIQATPFGQYTRNDRDYRWRALFFGPPPYTKDPGVALAELGPKAFPGLAGVLRNQVRTRTNENLLFVSVTPRASEALRTRGGFARVNALMRTAWPASRAASQWWMGRGYREQHRRKLKTILDDPLLSEIVIYIHPYGAVPLKTIVIDKMKRVPTPVELGLYFHGKEDAFFQRYKDYLRRVARGRQ